MADGTGNEDPLEQIVEHLAALRVEPKSELRAFRGEVNGHFVQMHVRFEELELRLDRIVENTGGGTITSRRSGT